MQYILLVIIFLLNSKISFAQKEEKLRFLITDSEQVDSAYIKTILQRIYIAAMQENIQTYNNPVLKDSLNISALEKIGEFCEVAVKITDDRDCNFEDTIICSPADYHFIPTFSLQYKNYQILPSSISIEFTIKKVAEIKYPNFWVDFSGLKKILTQKQISALLESTKFLPLIKDY